MWVSYCAGLILRRARQHILMYSIETRISMCGSIPRRTVIAQLMCVQIISIRTGCVHYGIIDLLRCSRYSFHVGYLDGS